MLVPDDVRQQVEAVHASPCLLVYEFAGAGSLALFWLHAVGGSSRTVLEATDRYSPASLDVGDAPAVAQETAQVMARRARERARALGADDRVAMGVACTATIATDREKRGDHRAHIAVVSPGGARVSSLRLEKGRHDRLGEEEAVSRAVLGAIADACRS